MKLPPPAQAVLAGALVIGTALVLSRFAALIQPLLALPYTWLVELGMVIGQVLFQWACLPGQSWIRRWDYALLVLGISFMGAILLLPLVIFHGLYPVPIPAALAYFFGVVGIMFVIHWIQVKAQGLPRHLCLTWVLYRCLLLLVLVRW